MFSLRSYTKKINGSRRKRFLLVSLLVPVIALLIVGTVWAVVPPSTFGYLTVCHNAGTPYQETLILREKTANGHITHGDPQVRCAVPLPNTAAGVPIDPAKGYFVEELTDGVYWVTEGIYQVMFVTTGAGVIVVDAPPSIGQNILNAIADVTNEPITHVIYSHSHADHISAASMYPDGATYIAHEETAAQLTRSRPFPFGTFVGGSPVPAPDVTFEDKLTLQVGDKTLELEYRGINHDAGNIFIYAPDQKVLMFIDVIFPGWTPFKDLAIAEDVPGYYQAHDEILSFDFDHLIAGHMGRLGTRQDVEIQKELMLDIQANAATALGTVDFLAIAGETGFENSWLFFDTYLDAVAQECTNLTLKKWLGELGGVDIFTFSHCSVVVESLRVD
jgi:glyoxylase-like metal-dependent hydrolase (beta-lactamase superfamily II)